jgi:pilus assembly protein Flp/PilA
MVMLNFKKLFNKNNEEKEEGQGLVEYALILFLVAVVVIAILILLGPQIGSVFSAVTLGLT